MYSYPADIYTEPEPDPDTLANLGPLTSMAGIWTSTEGMDVNPKPDGPERQALIERYELQPIDALTNGPQLLYGLRYHTRIVKPGDPETFHDQVGYWLWEPATRAILLTLSIPRGQARWPWARRLPTRSHSRSPGHAADHSRSVGAVSPHRSQPTAQDRRAHAESYGVSKRRNLMKAFGVCLLAGFISAN